jgi:hypothetical protein
MRLRCFSEMLSRLSQDLKIWMKNFPDPKRSTSSSFSRRRFFHFAKSLNDVSSFKRWIGDVLCPQQVHCVSSNISVFGNFLTTIWTLLNESPPSILHWGNANLRRFFCVGMFCRLFTQWTIFSSSKLVLELHKKPHVTWGCEEDEISFLTVDCSIHESLVDNEKCCSFGQTSDTHLLSIQDSRRVLAASNIPLDEDLGHWKWNAMSVIETQKHCHEVTNIQPSKITENIIIIITSIQPLGRFGRNQRPARRPVWLW